MTWEQLCLFCWGTGISIEHSYPAEGPSYYSMGEPAVLEPCICQMTTGCRTTQFCADMGHCHRCRPGHVWTECLDCARIRPDWFR